jgi:hypothetical protein
MTAARRGGNLASFLVKSEKNPGILPGNDGALRAVATFAPFI